MNQESYGRYEKFTFGSDVLTVSVITLGATVESLKFHGREMVLRYEDAEGYLSGSSYIGAAVGRYANRIGGARFTLNGREYVLPANEGKNQLHGGPRSYDKREWSAQVLSETSVRFTLISPDGDNGFPGELEASVTYTVEGGTLRLGAYPCAVRPHTRLAECYGTDAISERHRHRYEFNNDYRDTLTKAGLVISGTSPDGRLVETVEVAEHPFYVGVQFHPEFKSRPNRPHPLFLGLIRASLKE